MKLADQGKAAAEREAASPRERDRSRTRLPVYGRGVHVATGCVIIALAPAFVTARDPRLPAPLAAGRPGGRYHLGQQAE